MATSSTSTLFISHSAEDKPLADEIRTALNKLVNDTETSIKIRYSSSAEKGPQGGGAWRKWIEEQVVVATTALVLLTRESITRPWPLWEAGACRGVALMRRGESGEGAVDFPLVTSIRYGVSDEECPDPLRSEQIISGTDEESVTELFLQILDRHGVGALELGRAGTNMGGVVSAYLAKVDEALLLAPALVNEANTQEWLTRLDELVRANRWTELGGYQRWLNLSFGRDAKSKRGPIDVRLHRRLGEYHLQQMNYDDAIEQLSLARRSAPRDIYVLRRLGEALIKRSLAGGPEDHERIERVMERIKGLDSQAIAANPETAALHGKYLRRVLGRPGEAIETYRTALDQSPDSYYLADLLGQTQLETGDAAGAMQTYEGALAILKRLSDHNVWTLATQVTATLVMGDREGADRALRELVALGPSRDESKSIADGIRQVSKRLPRPVEHLDELLRVLSPDS